MMEEKMQEIPDGWCSITLSEVARHHSGKPSLIKGKLTKNSGEGLFPAFSATGQDVWRDDFEQEGSAIIISAVGARCGKCFKADGRWSAIANTHIVWPVEELIDRDFLWFKINDENFWTKGGSAQPFVKVRESFQNEFLLPPLNEQRRIVEKIERLFAQLNKGEEGLLEAHRLFSLYRKSVLKDAFSGRLVHQDPRDEPVADLLARIRKIRPAATADSNGIVKENTQEIPNSWQLVALNEVACHHSGNSNLIKGKLAKNLGEGLFPAFSATGQDVWRDDFEQEGSAIIISAVGARCGKCFKADGKWSAIANTHVVWPVEEIIDRDFLWFKINDENFWTKGGSAQPFVKTRESFHHKFPLPPLNEQHRIVEKIEMLFTQVGKIEEDINNARRSISCCRQSILRDAFAGLLVPQDPNDEPVADLLASIRKTAPTPSKKELHKR